MLPGVAAPTQPEEHETQGLMGSDDTDHDDVSPHALLNNTNIPINNTSSLTEPITNQDEQAPSKNRISRRDVNKRIQSYLRESDENCRESATLVAIVIIGLIVTGSVIGFLQLGHHDPHSIHKGSHASVTHFDGEELPRSLPDWIRAKTNMMDKEIKNNTLDTEETLGIQPLYRNYLLQTIYEYSFQSAIRIDKNDPIFQHVSMTYGGPWTVPPPPSTNNQKLRLQSDESDDLDTEFDTESDSETEKIVFDDISNIEMISLENGRNDHLLSFMDAQYVNNMNEWHCYLFEFANADQLVTKAALWKDYTFRITAYIDNFDMESGYDFMRVYVNSQYKGEVLTGTLKDKEIFLFRVDFDYLNEWKENDIPSVEVCFNIITDESIGATGFDITTKIEYENPEIVTWNTKEECHIETPTWRNPSRWDGTCGIGIQTKSITQCDKNLLKNLQIKRATPGVKDTDMDMDEAAILEQSGLYRGVCNIAEKQTVYCNKMDCGDAPVVSNKEIKSNPKLRFHYNGIGRIDPTYPDPFNIYRSTNTAIDIDGMYDAIKQMRDEIAGEYDDINVLQNAVSQHHKMDDSKIRLGLKLVRSLILGDTFRVAFTGSSNTAGHDNMFMSSYPMQLQSILRPLWKDIGYRGAAFTVLNRAVGGAIGTNQLAWCIPEITGGNAHKIDVIVWESTMNDAGSDDSRYHTMEEHIRNSLSVFGETYNGNVPNRPLWHAVIAGSNGDSVNTPIYTGYSDLIDVYSDYGAGIVEFNPSNGMNPIKKKSPKKWSDEHFYVTWHPGPVGHRIYAEIMAYFYLSAALDVLGDIQDTMKDLEKTLNMEIARPVLEMLDLLQDAPYKSGLPQKSKKCKPLCTDAEHSYCLMGFNPKDNVYEISKYVVNANKWKYESVAGNPQPIDAQKGGQASIDTKWGYKGNKESGSLIVSVKIEGNKYLMIEKPYADWGGLNDVLKKMATWFTAEIVDVLDVDVDENKKEKIMKQQKGKKLKCETHKSKQLWNVNIMEFGCILKFDYAGKYNVAFTVDTKEDIPICIIASF